MMQIDRKFFERIIQMLETEHMILYKYQDTLEVTEAWIAHVNSTIKQCKEINEMEKYQEEVQSLCTYWQKVENGELGGEDMYNVALRETIDLVAIEDEIGHEEIEL
jgi:hypothetical protein